MNLQPGGAAVFKRDGYGLFQSLPISCSTCAVHGGYHFQQVGGNDVQVWGNDIELAASVNDASFVKIATGTVSATWQCADSQGFAYCFSSSRDTPVKTDGSLANTTYRPEPPLGTMVAFTPLQMVVAGVSGSESTLYVSAQNNFLNFTVGVLPSSPFTEPIAAPGSRITHVAYYFGKLFWWKDQSFGFATFTNQNDWQLTIVSNQVGTLDNSDAFWNSSGFDAGAKFTGTAQANAEKSPGGIFFRGQDNHIYVYDGYYLTRLSRTIAPTVTSAARKKANSWIQTSQTDFQAGVSSPTSNLSTSISPGDVTVSSFSATEYNASTGWSSGVTNNTVVGTPGIILNTNNSGTINDPDFEAALATNYTGAAYAAASSISAIGCTVSPQSGTQFVAVNRGAVGISKIFAQFADINGSSVYLSTVTITPNASCSGWVQATLPSSGIVGRRAKVQWCTSNNGTSCDTAAILITKNSYIIGGDLTFYYRYDQASGPNNYLSIDNVQGGSSTITTGWFHSQVFDTKLSSPIYQATTFNYSVNTTTPTFGVFTSSTSTGPWSLILSTSGANAWGSRYMLYSTTITVASSESALTAISSVTVVAISTGSYYSAVNNAPNLTSWGTIGITDAVTGVSSITYYTRASTSAFTILSSTPAWVLQTKNSAVATSTGTFFQLRSDFYVTAATDSPKLSDFSFGWFEGTAADKAYISYFNDAIWFSVSASSSSSTNNRIFYWDILNGAWLVYDVTSNGFLVENNSLYFGDPVQGRVFKFGSVPTDNGAAINSYWRSKSFLGKDPFLQNEFVQSDFVLGESSTTLTYTYTVDSKTSTVFAFTVFDSSASLVQRNFLLPVGKIGKFYDFKIGDNSSAPKWVLMGHRVYYNPLNWKPVLN